MGWLKKRPPEQGSWSIASFLAKQTNGGGRNWWQHLAQASGNLTAARADNEDDRRRERVLNILLLGGMVLSLVAFIITSLDQLHNRSGFQGSPPLMSFVFLIALAALYAWTRRRFTMVVAAIFIGMFAAVGTYVLYVWGFTIPQGLLIYALVVVMSGVLLSMRAATYITGSLLVVLALLAWAQTTRIIRPDLRWLQGGPISMDAVGFVVTLVLIAIVSWLSNREIEQSLERARRSEASLKRQRDNLEAEVTRRTHELAETQMVRSLELQRFSEFGRLSAGFLHDMVNPLTAATLNLEALGAREQSELLKQVQQSLSYLERHVEAARRQLQERSELRRFSVQTELDLVTGILAHKARSSNVAIEATVPGGATLYGDPVKFNQLMANLIANAIEAYPETSNPQDKRRVAVTIQQAGSFTTIVVHDQGVGLGKANRQDIFQPFYSTKQAKGSGMGLGLAIVKRIVEDDFKGHISVTSDRRHGTSFKAQLEDRS